ncbi:MAG: hypothetical protein H7Y43_08770, partial [Akkermansiaceae bacterium]|nr:hypothetical protein [Verrucomicrobiales bacterium]
DELDVVSLGDFLDTGTPCCPFTMFEGVTELAPGQMLIVNAEGKSASLPWWIAPAEDLSLRLEDGAEEYARLWRRAVEKRCAGKRIGVQLSGGMDSRVVMAVVPRELECTGLTFCDELNREARISRQVAAAYGRQWIMLTRDPEYLGLTAPAATRFTGCEGEWHHAHALGLTRDFVDRGFDDVFTGLFMDNNFKGYYAEDIVPVTRLRGLLPPRHEIRRRDYIQATSAFCKRVLRSEVQEARIRRRQFFYDSHFARGRQSEWEWLDGYPVSQASDNTGWFVERRVMPLRLPVYDRALVELALRIPTMMKVHGDFFGHAIVKVLGPGNEIPNANDGARPGSSAVGKHLQRLARKTQRSVITKLEKLGWRSSVQHSWHDYKHYWRTSPVIKSLLHDHADGLAELGAAGSLEAIRAGLTDARLPWRQSYRLLQFALWSKNLRQLKASPWQESGSIPTGAIAQDKAVNVT